MLSVILAIAILVGVAGWAWQRQKKRRRPSLSLSSRHSLGKVPNAMRRELIRMAGSPQVAERLINNLRVKHPGETERWYWEKAIFDLQRDRRY